MNAYFAALLAAAMIVAFGQTAPAQTIYPGVQYQYGAYGEIFYGGQNPDILAHPYLNVPPQLIKSVNPRYTGPSAYYGASYGPTGSYPVYYGALPATRFNQPYYSQPQRFVFSDLVPYAEVGQYGFSEDDAHNEAYANVPRYQVLNPEALLMRQQAESHPAATPAPPASNAQTPDEQTQAARAKAQPLLNWARAEHARGHDKLVDMLVAEAAKFDSAAANAFRTSLQGTASER